jgi:hypothetical protein
MSETPIYEHDSHNNPQALTRLETFLQHVLCCSIHFTLLGRPGSRMSLIKTDYDGGAKP